MRYERDLRTRAVSMAGVVVTLLMPAVLLTSLQADGNRPSLSEVRLHVPPGLAVERIVGGQVVGGSSRLATLTPPPT